MPSREQDPVVEKARQCLSEDEIFLIDARSPFREGKPLPWKQIAAHLGVTDSRARTMRERAERKLSKKIAELRAVSFFTPGQQRSIDKVRSWLEAARMTTDKTDGQILDVLHRVLAWSQKYSVTDLDRLKQEILDLVRSDSEDGPRSIGSPSGGQFLRVQHDYHGGYTE